MYPEVPFDTFVCDLVISQLLLDKYVNSNTLVNAEHAVIVHHIRFINDIYVTDEHMDANFLIILDLFHQVGTGKYKVNIVGWVEVNIPYFFRVSSLAYPNLLGKKGYVVVVVVRLKLTSR